MNRGIVIDIVKGVVIFTISTILLTQWWGCSDMDPLAGSAGEVGNAWSDKDTIFEVKTSTVSGKLIDLKLMAMKARSRNSMFSFEVYLIPADVDPKMDADNYWVDVTDKNGEYLFEEIPLGMYNIVAISNPSGNMVFIPDLIVENETYSVPEDTVTPPGSIVVPLGPNNISEAGYVFIPGTNIFANVDITADRVILDSVPYGLYSKINFRYEGGGDPLILESNVIVMSNDSINISLLYCASSGVDPSKMYIKGVQLNTTLYSSDSTGLGYEGFTHKEFSVKQGDSIIIGIILNNPSNVNAEIAVFIDFNRDGKFNGKDNVFQKFSSSDGEKIAIVIPKNADLGKTRMRVKYNMVRILEPVDACETFSIGQVEDYTLFVETSTTL